MTNHTDFDAQLTHATLTNGTLIRNTQTRELGVGLKAGGLQATVLLCDGQEKGVALLLARSEVLTFWEKLDTSTLNR
jgi:hypothetical protein